MAEPTRRQDPASMMERAFSDEGLRDRLMPQFTPMQNDALRQKFREVYQLTNDWVSRFPGLNASTILPAAVIKIGQLPGLTPSAIATSVKWEIWVFAFDDMFDEANIAFNESSAIIEDCRRIVTSPIGSEDASTALGSSLFEIKQELSKYAQFSTLQPLFAATFERLVEGTLYVAQVRHPSQSILRDPPLEEYLYHGTNTFVHPFLWSLILQQDDTSILIHINELMELANQCGLACRLANDLSTFTREQRENVMNSVAIYLHQLQQISRTQTLEELKHESLEYIRGELMQQHQAAINMGTRLEKASSVAGSFLRLVDLSVGSYIRNDVRDWESVLMERYRPEEG
jgi:hypothetical protein